MLRRYKGTIVSVVALAVLAIPCLGYSEVTIPAELGTAVEDVSGLIALGVVALIAFLGLMFGAKSGVALVQYAGGAIKNFFRGGGR